jgi:RyR domain-containing protein
MFEFCICNGSDTEFCPFHDTRKVKMDHLKIAEVCHETNAAYCRTIGDHSQPTWDDAPQWQKDSALKGVEFHLGHLTNGTEAPASASHDSWLKQKAEEGWSYGSVKDPEKKLHPCFVPYEQLPLEQRIKDYLFGAVVKAFFAASTAETVSSYVQA